MENSILDDNVKIFSEVNKKGLVNLINGNADKLIYLNTFIEVIPLLIEISFKYIQFVQKAEETDGNILKLDDVNVTIQHSTT